MGLISRTTYVAGQAILAATQNTNEDAIVNLVNGNLDNANINASAGIVDTKLAQIATAGKVSGAALTSLADIPAGAGVIPAANLPTVNAPLQYRNNLSVRQASTTTITVDIGDIEVNGSILSKTSTTTLTITTAGDWAGGSSLQATSTTGYVGISAANALKLHTTAPTHSNYAVDNTSGVKRYATWSGTVYRIIGWFRMNATGSGELDAYGVSNLSDLSVRNIVTFNDGAYATGSTAIPSDDTIPQNTEGDQYMSLGFVPTNVNNKIRITVSASFGASASSNFCIALFQDSTANALSVAFSTIPATNQEVRLNIHHVMKAATISYTTFKVRGGGNGGGTFYFNGRTAAQLYGGVSNSFIEIEEISSTLT